MLHIQLDYGWQSDVVDAICREINESAHVRGLSLVLFELEMATN